MKTQTSSLFILLLAVLHLECTPILANKGATTRPVFTGEEEFTDLLSDPGERTNMAADPSCARRVGALRERLADLPPVEVAGKPEQISHA